MFGTRSASKTIAAMITSSALLLGCGSDEKNATQLSTTGAASPAENTTPAAETAASTAEETPAPTNGQVVTDAADLPELGAVLAVKSVSLNVPVSWDIGSEDMYSEVSTEPITEIGLAVGDGYFAEISAITATVSIDELKSLIQDEPTMKDAQMVDGSIGSVRTFSVIAIQNGTGRYTHQLYIETPADGTISVRVFGSDESPDLVEALIDNIRRALDTSP